jgi:hypothetical protein
MVGRRFDMAVGLDQAYRRIHDEPPGFAREVSFVFLLKKRQEKRDGIPKAHGLSVTIFVMSQGRIGLHSGLSNRILQLFRALSVIVDSPVFRCSTCSIASPYHSSQCRMLLIPC